MWLRRIARFLLGLLLLVAVLVFVVEVVLSSAAGRRFVLERLEPVLSDALDARVTVSRLDRLSLWGVDAIGVRLATAEGKTALSAAHVEASLRPLWLLVGKIKLTSVSVDELFVDLGAPLDDGGGLPGLFASDEPEADESSEEGSLELIIDRLRLSDARARAWIEAAEWHASIDRAVGSVGAGEAFGFWIESAHAELQRNDEGVGSLHATGRYDEDGAAHARVHARVGPSTISAQARVGAPADAGSQTVRASLWASDLGPRTLEVLGISDSGVRGNVNVQAHASGFTDGLGASLKLRSDAGDVQATLDLHWPERASLSARTERFELSKIIDAEVEPFAGDALLHVFGLEKPSRRFELELEHGRYAEIVLPAVSAEGSYDPSSGLTVDELSARSGSAQLTAKGELGADGRLELHAELEADSIAQSPAFASVVEGAQGALGVTLSLTREPHAIERAQIELRLTDARLAELSLASLRVQADATGFDPEQMQVAASVEGGTLRAGGVHVDQLDARLRGAHGRFDVTGTLSTHLLEGSSVREVLQGVRNRVFLNGSFEAHARRHDDHWTIDGRIDAGELRARLSPSSLRDDGSAELRKLEIAFEETRIEASGQIDPSSNLDLRAEARIPRLQTLTALVMTEPIHGTVNATIRAEGNSAAPRIDVRGTYLCPEVAGLRSVELTLDLDADLARKHAEADVRLRAEGARVSARATANDLKLAGLRDGRYEIELDIGRMPLHVLEPWPDAPAVPKTAVIAGSVTGEGTIEEPEISAALRAAAAYAEDDAPLQLELALQYADKQLGFEAKVRDQKGPLLRSSIDTELDGPRVPIDRVGFEKWITSRKWSSSLWLGARRIDELPALRALGVSPALWPARVSLDAKLAHEPGDEPSGELKAEAAWQPPGKETRAPLCGTTSEPFVALETRLSQGVMRGTLRGGSQGRRALGASFASNAPVDDWLRVKPRNVPPVHVRAELLDLELGDIPIVCEQAKGRVSGEGELKRGLTRKVTVDARLSAKALAFLDAPPFDAQLTARAAEASVRGQGTLQALGGKAVLDVELPIKRDGLFPGIATDQPMRADARFHDVPVAALVAPIPLVHATQGTLRGFLGFGGSLASPELRGRLHLHKVTLTLGELGQRFERAHGTVHIESRRLYFEDLEFQDLGGRAKADGNLVLHTLEPLSFDAKVALGAKQLPIRREGVLTGYLDGKVTADIIVRADRVRVLGKLRDARLELSDSLTREVQSLDENPDITFASDADADRDGTPTSVYVRIDAREPFWIRRSDFSALVSTVLTIQTEGGEAPAQVVGTIEIERGVIELFGQLFDIERSTIELTGGHEIDPTLHIVATRRVPGSGGAVVRIEAHGPVRAPQLSFFVDNQPVTAGEALAAALGTRAAPSGGADVEQELGSLATGIAGSVLTLGARRELGAFMPVIALERGGGETRVRAGVEAGRFVPKFLRPIVVDAYVEGIVSKQEQTEEGQVTEESSAQPAALLELRFPYDLAMEAQYGPGQRWSLDLGWEP